MDVNIKKSANTDQSVKTELSIESRYQETLNYLYSFVDFSLTKGMLISPDQFDLGRMRLFLADLGQPQAAYPVIHVTGTKGKGSVAALCASALQQAGYRVGLYTSPHLEDYAERIQLNGQPIPHADLIQLVEEFRPTLDQGTQLTTFEITTALAFLYFARQKAEVVVAEVGLGGRLDATNVVDPLVSVITSISYDHVKILGNTLAEIAGEKAGIIKPGRPVVVAPQPEEAWQTITQAARKQQAPLFLVGRDLQFGGVSHSLEGQVLEIQPGGDPPGPLVRLQIPLLGAHQVENAATAYAVLLAARDGGLRISDAAIQTGFARVNWPGRFEILQREPPVVIDSAHNRDSAHRLRQTIDEYFPGRPIVLLFGASEDKDIEGMFAELLPRVRQVILTRSFHPRAAEPDGLVGLVEHCGYAAIVVDSVQQALAKAQHLAGESAVVVCAGSIFIAAEVRHCWYNPSSGITI